MGWDGMGIDGINRIMGMGVGVVGGLNKENIQKRYLPTVCTRTLIQAIPNWHTNTPPQYRTYTNALLCMGWR